MPVAPVARRIDLRWVVALATALVLALAAVAAAVGDPLPTDLFDLGAEPLDPGRFPDRNLLDAVASAGGDAAATDRLLAHLSPLAATAVAREDFDAVAAQIGGEVALDGLAERRPDAVVALVSRDGARYAVVLQSAAGDESRIDGLFVSPVLGFDGGPISDVEMVLFGLAVAVLVGGGLVGPAGGWRFVAAGAVTSGAFLELAPWPVAQDVALLAIPAALVVALWALAGTGAGADRAVPRPVLAVAAGAAVTSLLPIMATDPGPVSRPWGHLVVVPSLQGHVDLLQAVASLGALAAAGAAAGWLLAGPGRALVGRISRRRGVAEGRLPLRREEAWRAVGGLAACGAVAGVAVAGLVAPAPLDLTASGWSVAALLAVGVGRVGHVLSHRADLATLSVRIADLGAGRADDLGQVIGRALDDPTVRIVHRRGDQWVDRTGHRVDLPDDSRRFTLLARDGDTVGAVIHHPRVAAEPERLRAACHAVTLSLANERLTAELSARLDEVRASRQRVLEAEDRARARLERDLHDGAQQRLTAAMLHLRILQQEQLQELAAPAALADGRLGAIGDEIQHAIDEIRELARGVRPAALDAGLGVAAEDLAERASLPVVVHDRLAGPVGQGLETVAWFVMNEAVVNASRHAAAHHVEIHLGHEPDGWLALTITDDGVGIPDELAVGEARRPAPGSGTGLVGLFDRVDAHGGTLRVERRTGAAGTVVEVRLPCGP